MLRRSVYFVCTLLCALAAQAQEQERLTQFDAESASVPPPWRVVHLDKKVAATRYSVTRTDGVLGIAAEADRSMALLARPVERAHAGFADFHFVARDAVCSFEAT